MGTTAEKLTYLNETKSKIKDNINLTGVNITNEDTFRSYAGKLKQGLLDILNNGNDYLYNNFPQLNGEGQNISLMPTLEAPIKSELLGNTSQNGTPTPDAPVEVINATGRQEVKVSNGSQEQNYEINLGYNLFKTPYNESSKTKNGITFTINEDGSIHVEGTATAKTQFNLRTRDLLLDLNIGEIYTIATSGLGAVDSTIWLDTYGQTGNFLGRWALTSTTPYTSAVAEAKDNKPFISITVENGATINTDVKVWLYKGAYDSSIEYAQYKTPIELCKIGDYQDSIRKGTGKNLMNHEYNKGSIYGSFVYDNDIYTFTPSSTNVNARIMFLIPRTMFKAGTTYTIKANGTNRIAVGYADSLTDTSYYTYFVNVASNEATFTYTSIPKDYVNVYFYNTNSTLGTNWTLSEVQLNEGSTTLPYEPYGSKGKWLLTKNIGKVVLDGSENWVKSSTTTVDRFSISYNVGSNTLLSNYFVGSTSWVAKVGTIMTNINMDTLAINYSTYGTTDLATFKTWLSTHNTTLYYILSTPTIEEITDSTLLNDLNNLDNAKSYNGTTNITITAETPADIKITALKNE